MALAPLYGISRLRFNIDGTGVRTLVCFRGCPLNCRYCLNYGSRNITDDCKVISVGELIEELSVDSLYFQATNGGVTFGGGEPLLYAEFISEFINKANNNWNYWIETSLNVPYENLELIKDRIDKFIIDIKSINKDIYRSYTGIDNDIVLSNLKRLIDDVGSDRIIVRVPYIEGYTTRADQQESTDYIRNLGINNIDMFDYRAKE